MNKLLNNIVAIILVSGLVIGFAWWVMLPSTSNLPKITSQQDFDKTISDNKLAVVDFYTDSCHVCRQISPLMDRLAKEFSGKASIVGVNARDNAQLARKFEIQGVPTIVFFADGKEVGRQLGMCDYDTLRSMVLKAEDKLPAEN